MRGKAFSLVELLVVLAVLALLLALLVPSLGAAGREARLAACTGRLRAVGAGVGAYAAAHRMHLPPFAFSDHHGNLPLSGHWGGPSQACDPAAFGRRGVWDVNLWRLVRERMVVPAGLICPGADEAVEARRAGWFARSSRFSTYCLRVPRSADVFRDEPDLADWNGTGLLGIFTAAGGAERVTVAQVAADGSAAPPRQAVVPCLRLDRRYEVADPDGGTPFRVDLIAGALAADGFWYQLREQPASMAGPGVGYDIRAGWTHRDRFNVLSGDGAVRRIRDDGVIAANTIGPGAADLPDDGARYATYAARVWRRFDRRR